MARPKRRRVNAEQLRKLISITDCTMDEAAAFFDVARATLYRQIEGSPRLAAAVERGRAMVRIRLRRALWRLVHQKDDYRAAVAATIFLSKNLLGYRDTVPIELTGRGGGPIDLRPRLDL